jgi:hypothetical protein
MDNTLEDQLFILLLNSNTNANVSREMKDNEQKLINDYHAIQLHNLHMIIESQNKILLEYKEILDKYKLEKNLN